MHYWPKTFKVTSFTGPRLKCGLKQVAACRSRPFHLNHDLHKLMLDIVGSQSGSIFRVCVPFTSYVKGCVSVAGTVAKRRNTIFINLNNQENRKGKERIDKKATHKWIVLKGPICRIIRVQPWWQALMHKWCCQSMDNFIELCQA